MYIISQGVVSQMTRDKLSNKLNHDFKDNGTVFLFCDYSMFEIPLGRVFNYIIECNSTNRIIKAKLELVYITQEFFQPYDFIPVGHKTICQFNLNQKAYKFISEKLPVIDTWKPLSYFFSLSTDCRLPLFSTI